MTLTVFLVLLSELWNTLGQVLFKQSTNRLSFAHEKSLKSYLDFLTQVIGQPRILLGLLAMAAGLIFWLLALSQAELSVVFPLGSIQYILILFASRLFLSETTDALRIFGTLLITLGIAFTMLGEV